MSDSLHSMIRCPSCKRGRLERSARGYRSDCGACGASFALREGVLDLLPGVTFDRSVSQFFMEFPPLIRIYESRWWRRSAVAAFLLAISFEEECEAILKAAGLKDQGDLLDLACGPGIYTRPMAKRLGQGRVVGLDISFPMLRQAAENASRESLNNILFLRANAMDLPFADATFGCVNCAGALHLFPDARQVTREVARVLTPKGTFTVAAVRRSPGMLGGARAGFLDRVMGIRSFTAGDLTAMLKPHGFNRFSVLHDAGLFVVMSAARG